MGDFDVQYLDRVGTARQWFCNLFITRALETACSRGHWKDSETELVLNSLFFHCLLVLLFTYRGLRVMFVCTVALCHIPLNSQRI